MGLRIGIIHNQEEKSILVLQRLRSLLAEKDDLEIVERDPELVITIGGDGTLLSAFHRYNHRLDKVRFLGVHTGHLGFYTDWRDYELPELVNSLSEEQGKSVSYPLLDILLTTSDGEKKHFLALNESTIRKGSRTMVADVYIKQELFERFRGDGLAISTPTGSTAYNKSVGGAVVHPSINAMQLAEIASLNNRVFRTLGSPSIIGPHEWIDVRLNSNEPHLITIDQLDINRKDIKSIKYKIAEERIHFASYRHMHFWHRVKDAFIRED
ncbi:NAD kinase [Enterococcus pseudoavium]|uniref:NAD kinase n=1 Tax=Enterococcus pseudoavium TaxID=44007 RepID=A0AAE4I0W3_9ENTE|nr:NAD kinase [Enterococcus pseudoavium]MDT2737424.1 NAD kinase [Enterococcus pseudoavium]MDT2754907.1 NAD kinase [Enterococcus pseudoavium]MDT2770274.1 NAD kinase [Enterococcus pseudoavium]REC33306.1 NAD kinase [Enterococcus pseudoavium]